MRDRMEIDMKFENFLKEIVMSNKKVKKQVFGGRLRFSSIVVSLVFAQYCSSSEVLKKKIIAEFL